MQILLGNSNFLILDEPTNSSLLHATEEIDEVTYSGVEEALQVAETDVRLFGKPSAYPGRRMGLIMATADDVSEARDRAAIAASKITISAAPRLVPESELTSEKELSPDDVESSE